MLEGFPPLFHVTGLRRGFIPTPRVGPIPACQIDISIRSTISRGCHVITNGSYQQARNLFWRKVLWSIRYHFCILGTISTSTEGNGSSVDRSNIVSPFSAGLFCVKILAITVINRVILITNYQKVSRCVAF